MKKAVIALMEKSVRVALLGNGGRKRKSIEKLYKIPLAMGTPEKEGWLVALEELWQKEGLPRCSVRLCIANGRRMSKVLALPRMPEKKLAQIVAYEMRSPDDEEMISDYTPLGKNSKGEYEYFCAACSVKTMEQYLRGMDLLNLKVECITVPMATQLKLLSAMPEMHKMTCLWMVFDGSSVFMLLAENGQYRYATRTQIFSESGTLDFGTEIVRSVSGVIQFQSTDQSRPPITNVYYAGCPDDDFEVCIPGLRDLGVEVARLPNCSVFPNSPWEDRMSDWTYCAGLML